MVIIGTGLLVLALVRQTTTKIWIGAAAGIFFIVLMNHFWLCFEYTHDGWLILLTFDLLIAGVVWCHPLEGWIAAAAWGLFGGTAAMINPGVGLAWVLLSVTMAYRLPAWSHLGMAFLVATLTLAPWGPFAITWNSAALYRSSRISFYEMYQTQCLQADGFIANRYLSVPPVPRPPSGKHEFSDLGETAYLDRKREQFLEAVRADPFDYLDRVASRFLAATLWYVPFRCGCIDSPWVTLGSRLLQHATSGVAVPGGDGLLAKPTCHPVAGYQRLFHISFTVHRGQLLRALHDAAAGREDTLGHLGARSSAATCLENKMTNHALVLVPLAIMISGSFVSIFEGEERQSR